MPPGAAFCPVFGGAFTVRFVTFSVVMGDGTDLNPPPPWCGTRPHARSWKKALQLEQFVPTRPRIELSSSSTAPARDVAREPSPEAFRVWLSSY